MAAADSNKANEVWTIKRALDWTQGYLASKGDDNPRLSAQWLIGEACGLSRMQLYTSFDTQLTRPQLDVLHGYVARRASGEPLQYITGEAAFRHIVVKVAPGVLIPRPETEVLVSEALALLPAAPRPRVSDDEFIAALAAEAPSVEDVSDDDAYADVRRAIQAARDEVDSRVQEQTILVADICTGTGCIACSIASEHPRTHVIATDISAEALSLAAVNVVNLGLAERVDVLQSDLGAAVDPALLGSFDLVVSNPPYIPTAVLGELPAEVSQFEPALALDGGEDGLDLYRRLLDWCKQALRPGGHCAFELHETTLDQAKELAEQAGFENVSIKRDLADRPRILIAKLPE